MKAGIVGGGILGRLLAFFLVKADWQVTVFEKDENSCSSVAAGLLTPIAELEHSSLLIYQMGLVSLHKLWPAIIKALPDTIYFQNHGSLLLAHARDQNELSRFISMLSSKSNLSIYQPLSHTQIKDLEPALYQFDQGYYLPDEGQVDNQALLTALKKDLINKNVNWLQQSVIDVKPYQVVLADTMNHFDMVFDCRGLGGKSYFEDLRGVRGELIWLYNPDVKINRPIRILHPRYKVYLSPRPNHVYILGASEIESEDVSAISVKTMLELLSAVYSLHPSFSEARIIKTLTHCRPTLANHLPKIHFTSGLLALNGLYRHGFLISPALVADTLRFLEHGISAVHFPTIWSEIND